MEAITANFKGAKVQTAAFLGNVNRFYVAEDKNHNIKIMERSNPSVKMNWCRPLCGPFMERKKAEESIPQAKIRLRTWGVTIEEERTFHRSEMEKVTAPPILQEMIDFLDDLEEI